MIIKNTQDNIKQRIMWILCSKVENHGKETCLALEPHIWDCLTSPLVPTILRLDWERKDNWKTKQLFVTITQEQKVL